MQSFAPARNTLAKNIQFEIADWPQARLHTDRLKMSELYRPVGPALDHKGRHAHFLVRINRLMRTALISLCGVAILGYGLDVAASNDVCKLQEQAHRLSEQNTELSAQLLRVISFQGIQDNLLGRFGLSVPDQVLIVKEVQPFPLTPFQAQKHHLPLLAGY